MRSNLSLNIVSAPSSASFNGSSIIADQLIACSAQAVNVGTGVGTVKLQASNDGPGLRVDAKGNPLPTNWNDITGATVAVSGAGPFLIPKIDLGYRYIRAVYTFTSGTGTISVNIATLGY